MEIQKAAIDIPSEVYYVAGAIIITNVGTIVSLLFAAFKSRLVGFEARLESRGSESHGGESDVVFYAPSLFKIEMSGAETGFVTSTINQFSLPMGISCRFTVPVSGWQP